ncbi:MAG: DinB family protein [Bacteroidetes bacterium]|nr:DinB family protein [Bacteroidota bacterium]
MADTFESVRALSKSFISKIEEKDIHENIVVNGKELNSPYWIVAHLIWAESFLLGNAIGNPMNKYEWLNEYGFGMNPKKIKSKPEYSEVLRVLDETHEEAMKYLRSLPDSFLDEANKMGINFSGKTDNRVVIHHAIRHEPMHIGQLTWFMKSKGMQTV